MCATSKKCAAIKPLSTTVIKEKCAVLKSEGKDVIDLSIGDTDFRAPESLSNAVYEAIQQGFTHYTPSIGIKQLRESIASHHSVNTDEIMVSVGGKEGICCLFLAFLNPGDEVVVPEPYWPALRAYATLVSARLITIPTRIEDDFQPAFKAIERVISDKTKLIILNSPNNPTGAVYSFNLFEKISDLAKQNNFIFLSDEIYSKYDYSGDFKSAQGLNKNVVVLDGYSKTFGMTGIRLCYLIASKDIIRSINKIHTYVVGNATSIAQYGSINLYNELDYIEKNHSEMRDRSALAFEILKDTPGLAVNKPKGAFYMFPKYTMCKNSVDLCSEILEKKYVGLVPGDAFGCENHFRIAFSQPEDRLLEGLKRIRDFFSERQSQHTQI